MTTPKTACLEDELDSIGTAAEDGQESHAGDDAIASRPQSGSAPALPDQRVEQNRAASALSASKRRIRSAMVDGDHFFVRLHAQRRTGRYPRCRMAFRQQ